jgi:hypothetical protein
MIALPRCALRRAKPVRGPELSAFTSHARSEVPRLADAPGGPRGGSAPARLRGRRPRRGGGGGHLPRLLRAPARKHRPGAGQRDRHRDRRFPPGALHARHRPDPGRSGGPARVPCAGAAGRRHPRHPHLPDRARRHHPPAHRRAVRDAAAPAPAGQRRGGAGGVRHGPAGRRRSHPRDTDRGTTGPRLRAGVQGRHDGLLRARERGRVQAHLEPPGQAGLPGGGGTPG